MTNDVCQPFATSVLTFNGFTGDTVSDNEEDFRKISVVRAQDNGVVAVDRKQDSVWRTDTWICRLYICTVLSSYLSMRSQRKSNVCTASSLSSLSGSQLSQWGSTSLTLTHSGWKRMTLPTAEMQFSVAFMFSLERESGSWITPTSLGMASGKRTHSRYYILCSIQPLVTMELYLCRTCSSWLLRTEP